MKAGVGEKQVHVATYHEEAKFEGSRADFAVQGSGLVRKRARWC